jgi:hypothetical protein
MLRMAVRRGDLFSYELPHWTAPPSSSPADNRRWMTVAGPLRRRQSHDHGETLATIHNTVCYCSNAAVALRGSDEIIDDGGFLGY